MMNLAFHRKFFGHLLPLSNAGICRKTEFAEGLIACLAHFGNRSDALFPYSLQACLREAVLVTCCARGKMRTCFSHCFLLCCGWCSFHRLICFKGFLGPVSCVSFLSCVQSVLCTPLAWAHPFVLVLVGTFVIMR